MNATQDIIQKAAALANTAQQLRDSCDRAIAKIEEIEAKAAESHKANMTALDAMLAMIDNFSKPKEVTKDHPVGIAFVEGVGVREMKP